MSFEFFPQSNIILQIGNISLYFYGAMYAVAAISAYFFTRYWVRKFQIQHCTSDDIIDIIFWTVLFGVIGGRVFYMLVYNLPYFLSHPFALFTVWKGGMSIHGGLIGGVIGFLYIIKKKKLNTFLFADISVVSIAFGMALGRVGNFMNKELVGRVTDVAWAMDFGDGVMRHPAQLYAVGKDLLLFTLFWYILTQASKRVFYMDTEKKHIYGKIFFGFLMMYALFRFIVEFFRQPDPQLGFVFFDFSMGQVLSVILFVIGSTGFFIRLIKQ